MMFTDSNENVQSGILSQEHQNQHVATNVPPGNDGNPPQASQLELVGHSVVRLQYIILSFLIN